MVDAKRLIKKELPAAQAIINQVIDREVEDANRLLKSFVEKLLKPWYSVDGRRFDLPYLEFEGAYEELEAQVRAKKEELKEKISSKLKAEMRTFYSQLFDF